MAKITIKKASTDVSVYVFAQDSSKTTGVGLAGLAYNTASLVAYYVRPLGSAAAITLATQTVTGAHTDGGFVEVDATNMPGVYRLDLPDAVCATGVPSVVVMLKGATNLAPVLLEIQLTDLDLNTSFTAGLVADAVWDEATADHTTATTFGALDINVDAILADTGTDGVLLSAGTGAKQIALSSGAVLLQATQNGVTIPTVTTLTNLPAVTADWLTAAGVKADAVTKIQSGLALEATLTAIKGAGWSTETLAAIDVLIDAIKAKTDVIPASPAQAGEYTAAIGAIPTAPLLASNYTAPNNAGITAILEDTGTTIPAQITALNNLSAAQVNAEVVDVLRTDLIPDSYAADGAQPTIAQAILAIHQFLLERAVSSTTLTVKKPDGSTTAMTFTLNDATSPTAITRAT